MRGLLDKKLAGRACQNGEIQWSESQVYGTTPKLLISFPQHSLLEMQASGVIVSRVAERKNGVMCIY